MSLSLPVGYSPNLLPGPLTRLGRGIVDLNHAVVERLLTEPNLAEPIVPNTVARALLPRNAASAEFRKDYERLCRLIKAQKLVIPHLDAKSKIWASLGRASAYPYLAVMAVSVAGFFLSAGLVQLGVGLGGLEAIPVFGDATSALIEYASVIGFSAPQLTGFMVQGSVLTFIAFCDQLGERAIRGNARLADTTLRNFQKGLKSIAQDLQTAGSKASPVTADEATALKLAAFQKAFDLYINVLIASNRRDLAEGVALELLTSYSRSDSANVFRKMRQNLHEAIDNNLGPLPYDHFFVSGGNDMLREQINRISQLAGLIEAWLQANPRHPALDGSDYSVLRDTVRRLQAIRVELENIRHRYIGGSIEPHDFERLSHRLSRIMGSLNVAITRVDSTVFEVLRERDPAALNALLGVPPGGAGPADHFFVQRGPTNQELAALLEAGTMMFINPLLNHPSSFQAGLQKLFAGIRGNDPKLIQEASDLLPETVIGELNGYLLYMYNELVSLSGAVVDSSVTPLEFASKLVEFSKSLDILLDNRGYANGLTRFGNAVQKDAVGVLINRAENSAVLNLIGYARSLFSSFLPRRQDVGAR